MFLNVKIKRKSQVNLNFDLNPVHDPFKMALWAFTCTKNGMPETTATAKTLTVSRALPVFPPDNIAKRTLKYHLQ